MLSQLSRVILILALTVIAFSSTQPLASQTFDCRPGPDEVAFFDDSNFHGACKSLGIGEYQTAFDMNMANDSISSIRVGSGVQTLVCQDGSFEGKCELITGDDPNLGNNTIGHDRISSAKVQVRGSSTTCRPSADQAAFFQNSNFGGACEVRGVGQYGSAIKIGVRNDSISSVRVGANVQAVLCRDTGFGGDCELLQGDDANLSNNKIGGDSLSSAKVQIRGQQDCVPNRDQVALFKHAGHLAPCIILDNGN